MSDTVDIVTDVQTKEKYKPRFPDLYNGFIDYFNSQNLGFRVTLDESVTKSTTLVLANLESFVRDREFNRAMDTYDATAYEGRMQLVLYVQNSKMAEVYDRVINVLHGFGAKYQLMDVRVMQRSVYPVNGQTDIQRVFMLAQFTYIDYTVDTTYPVIPADKCGDYTCQDLTLKDIQITYKGLDRI